MERTGGWLDPLKTGTPNVTTDHNATPAGLALLEVVNAIRSLDPSAMRRARQRQSQLTKPPGSLGRLEALSVQLAGILGTEKPVIRGKSLIVAAGDHGVVAQGVTGYPQQVTAQMVLNFLAGGAAVSVMARQSGVRLVVVDAGVAADLPAHPGLRRLGLGRGAADISLGPAMPRAHAEAAVLFGVRLAREAADAGSDLIATGDMGIGNTTSSAAIVSAITGVAPEMATGKGTGRTPDQLRRKAQVVERALSINRPDPGDPLGVLSAVGGYEIGVLAGVILGGAMMRRAVVVDGFISGAAALIACGVCPTARGYLVAAHRSAERGHRAVLRHLRLQPLLDLQMRLGEGTGAVLAMPIVETAAACLTHMATFAEAGVAGRASQETT